ncbi:MAG: DEAD/DEAH box helicase [candidate division FCPU426 bacterium]
MTFAKFHIDPRLQASVKKLGFSKPTPIQSEAIPPILEGKDLVGTARTGTGKTLAFALPLLNHLLTKPPRMGGKTRALILAPTRELAQQIHASFQALLPGTNLRSATVYGGVGFKTQEDALRRGVEIIVACPGRLIDHMQARIADLRYVEALVLDEADQMFDMGFLPPLRQIVSHLPKERQTLLFSATFAPELQALIKEVCRHPVRIDVAGNEPTATVAHALYPVPHHLKTALLLKIMEAETEGTILVFTRTKHRANKVSERLEKEGWKTGVLHSNKSQAQRHRALQGFRNGQIRVLVATDIAARGIDVAGVTHVINFDIPESATTYIHRIGRTGRAEKNGDALTLVSREDQGIVRDIERALGKPIERRELKEFDYNAAAPQGGGGDSTRSQERQARGQGRRPSGQGGRPSRSSSQGSGPRR